MAWMLILLLAGAGAGYVAIDRLWEQRHEYIRSAIETTFAEHMPDWRLEFRQATLDDDGRLRIEEVTLAPKDSAAALLEIPEMVLELDEEMLQSRQIYVRRIQFERPVVRLVRDSSGNWNVAPLPTVESTVASPEIVIHDGTVLVRLEETLYTPAIEVSCHHVEGGLSPSGWQQYDLVGETSIDHAGSLSFEGAFNLLTGKWQLAGGVRQLHTAKQLFEIAAGLSEEMRGQLAELANAQPLIQTAEVPGALMGQPSGWDARQGLPTQAISNSTPFEEPPTNLGLDAVLDVEFSLSQANFNEPVDYIVDLTILSGSIDNDALPVPLSNLQGSVSLTPEEVVIDNFSATNGNSELLVSGTVSRELDGRKDLTVKARNLTLGPDLGRYLPAKFGEMYALLSPSGEFDVDVRYNTANAASPLTLNEFTARDCTLIHGWFQYPVHHVNGTIRQQGEQFEIVMEGKAGQSPVSLCGIVVNPGPEAEAQFNISTRQLPVDLPFILAFAHERWQAVRAAMEALELRGVADWDLVLVRPPGADQRWNAKVDGILTHGSVTYVKFPLPLRDVAGEVHYDGLSDGVWHFDNLVGKHGNSVVTGHGSYSRLREPGLLDLKLTAHNVPLDRELRFACSAANSMFDTIWDEVNPEGQISLHGMQILWSPGTPAAEPSLDITLPSILLTEGRFTLRAIPYTWDDVAASATWRDDQLHIHTLTGWHGDTFLQIDGNAEGAAYVEGHTGGAFDWHVHFEDIALRDVDPGDELRAALPRSLASVLEAVNPRGRLNARLGLDMKGFPPERHRTAQEDFVTANWRMQLDFEGIDLTLGVELANATGRFTFLEGVWDGDKVKTEGWGEFESVEVFDLPFQDVSAPFVVDGNWAIVGTPGWLEQGITHHANNQFAGKSVEAQIYGGELVLDTIVDLSSDAAGQTQYRVDAHLRNAKLERWAADKGQSGQLSGEVFCDVWLAGAGPSRQGIQGAGRIQVMPAALYELPVIVQLFSVANPGQVDRTAFQYAYGEFGVDSGLLNFSQIRLIGQSIALAGRGEIGFAEDNFGRVALDFQVIPQNRIPVIGSLIQNIGGQFVTVHVDGTMNQPRAESRGRIPVPVLDEIVQSVMGSLESGANPMLGPFTPARPLPPLGPTAERTPRPPIR